MTKLVTNLDAAKSHDIRELMNMLQANGCDNYTYAICEIAVDGELSDETREGLTTAEHQRLIAGYRDDNEWDRDAAVEAALEAAAG